jgi:hypothetical protein
VASALMRAEDGLVWQVTPYSFVVKDTTIWEPKAPFDRIPYQLFSDGVRILAMLPGLPQQEFDTFLRILVLDRATEMAPEDDFVTLLWDSDFDHIAHEAIDTYVEGGQEERADFERKVNAVVALAKMETPDQLEDAWKDAKREPSAKVDAADHSRRIHQLLRASTPADVRTAAQTNQLRLPPGSDEATALASALQTDPVTIDTLATRLDPGTFATGERFVRTVAIAYREALANGWESGVASPLRSTIDGLSLQVPDIAIEMLSRLCDGLAVGVPPEEATRLQRRFTDQVVSKQTMAAILAGANSAREERGAFIERLRQVLRHLGSKHVPPVLEVLPQITDTEVSDLLIAYVAAVGKGYEMAMAGLFAEASLELGLALVRILASMGTPESKEAIIKAATSRHPMVRIEALGHVEGLASDRLRQEIRALLEDDAPRVRIAAMRAMADHNIRVAGPFLVLRVKDEHFDDLSVEEKEVSLATLVHLASSRAESACVEILKQARMLASDSHEESRELAAKTLSKIAVSREALVALEEAAAKKWKNSERVRLAAASALTEVTQRAKASKAAEPQPKGSKR